MLTLAAYADRLSVRPGETIAFKVSSQLAEPYRARLVRVICADANPAGPGLKEEPVATEFEGSHPSRNQPIHQGSYARIDNSPDLSSGTGLTFVATIWPTTPMLGRRQGILSAFDPTTRTGFALAINEDGSAEAMLGATRVKTRVPLEKRRWYRISASWDANARTLRVSQVPLVHDKPQGPGVTATETVPAGPVPLPVKGMPWFIGALGSKPIGGHFNGKIEAPAIWTRPLSGDDAATSAGGSADLVARWDFARAIDTTPTTCLMPVSVVRSSGMAGKPSLRFAGLMPPWMMFIMGRFGGAAA